MNRRLALKLGFLSGGLLPTASALGQQPRKTDDFGGSGSARASSRARPVSDDDEIRLDSEPLSDPDRTPVDGNLDMPPANFKEESGHSWRSFDIARYVSRAASPENPKPQNAIVEWIFRRTGSSLWHGEKNRRPERGQGPASGLSQSTRARRRSAICRALHQGHGRCPLDPNPLRRRPGHTLALRRLQPPQADRQRPARPDALDHLARRGQPDPLPYFGNHAHRMDYPTYLANGWQIGSGPVESACKTVVGNRLKGGGMRWGEPGSDAVCHLRAVYLSDPTCWDRLWQHHAA